MAARHPDGFLRPGRKGFQNHPGKIQAAVMTAIRQPPTPAKPIQIFANNEGKILYKSRCEDKPAGTCFES
jgi:hypothetical protein